MASETSNRGPRWAGVTWLGQAGFLIRSLGGACAVIDAFLSDYELRTYPPPSLDVLGERVDVAIATHEHGDHLDTATLLSIQQRFADVTVIVPKGVVEMATAAGLQHVVGLEVHDSKTIGEFDITAVPAIHAVQIEDGYQETPPRGGRWLGYVLNVRGGPVFWHGGDTLISPAVVAAVSRRKVDVAMLPINGRDAEREGSGIVGNADAAEAVQAAVDVGASCLLPMHYDLITGNTAPAGAAADAANAGDARLHILSLRRFVPHVVAVPAAGDG